MVGYIQNDPIPPAPPQKPIIPPIPETLKFLLKVIVSAIAFGVTYIMDHQAAIIMAVAIVVTYVFNWVAHYLGRDPGRNAMTGVLFGISILLTVLFNPGIVPPFVVPVDQAQLTPYAITWLGLLAAAATPIVGGASAIYNILLKDVLDDLIPLPEEVKPPEISDMIG